MRLGTILLLLLLAACGNGAETATPPAPKPAAPRTAPATPAEAAPLARVPAMVTLPPDARVAVAAPVAGLVRELRVIEGQDVAAGATLALLESREALAFAADRARAEARVRLAEADVRRLRQLVEEGIVAAARLDEAEAGLASAQAERELAARSQARAHAGADGTVRLISPIAGRVAHVGTTAGAPADTGSALFLIERRGEVLLSLQLAEALAGRVRPGMAVEVANGIRGQIVSVAPSLDPSARAVTAMARLGSAPGLLPGSSVEATILAPAGPGAVAVPAEAVVRDGGRDIVFVATENGFRPRPVAVATRAGGVALLLEGLTAGERVAVSNLPELRAAAGQ